jgi:hypothetical protein
MLIKHNLLVIDGNILNDSEILLKMPPEDVEYGYLMMILKRMAFIT